MSFELTAEQKRAWLSVTNGRRFIDDEIKLAAALETQLARALKSEWTNKLLNKYPVADRIKWTESDWLAEARRILGED